MSYICHFCKKVQPDRTPCRKIILEYRLKTYPLERRITTGWEIVKEVNACPACAESNYSNIPPKKEKPFQECSWFREFAQEEYRKLKHKKEHKFDKTTRINIPRNR